MKGTIPSLPSLPTVPRLGLPGGGVSAAEVDLLVNPTAPAAGTALSPANITAAEVGGAGGTWDYRAGRPNPLVSTTIEDVSVTRFWALRCAGQNVQSATKCIEFDLSGDDANWEGLQRSLPAGHPNATLTMVLYAGSTGD